jgi:hypothetical protein
MSHGPENEDIHLDPLGPDFEPEGEGGGAAPGDAFSQDFDDQMALPLGEGGSTPVGGDYATGGGMNDADRDFRSSPGPPDKRAQEPRPAGRSRFSALREAVKLTDVYTWLLGISVVAMFLGVLLLYGELKRHNFEIKPPQAQPSAPSGQ